LFFVFDAVQYLISLMKYQDLAEEYDEKISQAEITETKDLVEPKNINKWLYRRICGQIIKQREEHHIKLWY